MELEAALGMLEKLGELRTLLEGYGQRSVLR